MIDLTTTLVAAIERAEKRLAVIADEESKTSCGYYYHQGMVDGLKEALMINKEAMEGMRK